jgi:SAM-dependent methyltransferase
VAPEAHPHVLGDIERGLPFRTGGWDAIIAMNVLEHIFDHRRLLEEAGRVLRQGGQLCLGVPFLVRVHLDPDDHFRYTASALRRLLTEAGFAVVEVKAAGRGPLTVAAEYATAGLPAVARAAAFTGTSAVDRILGRGRSNRGPDTYPLGYVVTATR